MRVDGIIIGIFSLMSFSLYRAAHQCTAYLASERDEAGPLSIRNAARGASWRRGRTHDGTVFTPFLFVRTSSARFAIRNKLRRRIWAEFAVTAVIWTRS
jgi:hypothetical protein